MYQVRYDLSKPIDELPVGAVRSHFLDSGSFTLWTKAAKYAEENQTGRWAYYDTDEFWEYMDGYCEFIKKNKIAIDLYANIDVIPNPKLSYRNQKYMEKKHGLTPVPVVHYGTDLRWLQFYVDRGHDIIGLGGLVGSTSQHKCRAWLDECFRLVCPPPSYLPKVKLHGFGITTHALMVRFPWYSVDSTAWTKIGGFGGILVPHKRKGKFVFDEEPYVLKCSLESPNRKRRGAHVLTLTPSEIRIIEDWLDFIGMKLGKWNDKGEVLEYGVVTRHLERRAANILFFEAMRESLPEYPWAFRSARNKGFFY